jgi:hypothetical protein
MRWAWAAVIPLLVVALPARRALHVPHAEAAHVHSHGHWHGAEYHEHHHGHDEIAAGSLDDHAQEPHEHGWADWPEEDSSTPTPVIAAARRDHWNPAQPLVIAPPFAACAPAPDTPPPRSRAGRGRPPPTALRSIRLQV